MARENEKEFGDIELGTIQSKGKRSEGLSSLTIPSGSVPVFGGELDAPYTDTLDPELPGVSSQNATDPLPAEVDKRAQKQKDKRAKGKANVNLGTVQKMLVEELGEGAETEALLAEYGRGYAKMDDNVTDDIFSERSFKLDLIKPELISVPYLESYFKTVVGAFTDYNRQLLEAEYDEYPSKWLGSASNRGRLVLLEVKDDNIMDIAEAIVHASPLERVVAVGLDTYKAAALKTELETAWNNKIEDHDTPEAYRGRLIQGLNEKSEGSSKKELSSFGLEELMGPHAFVEATDISYTTLQRALEPSFSSKVDEVILFGITDSLAQELLKMAVQAEAEQYLALLDGKITPRTSPYWTASLITVEKPIELLVSSKHPRDILVEDQEGVNENVQTNILAKAWNLVWPGYDKEVIPTTQKNFQLNPNFERIFANA